MTPPFRVLIADDDAALRLLLTISLGEDDRFDVVGVIDDGREVVDRVREADPDVLVLDLDLPGRGGLGVIEDLGEVARPLVVVLSASGVDGRGRALGAGASAYLDKAAVAEDIPGALHDAVTTLGVAAPVTGVSAATGEGAAPS